METKKSINIAVDCDEILTNISPLWSHLIHKNGEYFGKYFDLKPDFDLEKDERLVLMRDTFYLNQCFRKENLEISEEEEKVLYERFMSLYDNDKFYSHCKPTKLANALNDLGKTNYINKIYVVSRTTPNTTEGKRKFIERAFKDCKNKVEFIPVGMDEKKSDVINRLNNIDVYYDDELKNVFDIIDNTDPNKEMDIYIPRLGYNRPTEELSVRAEKNNKKILYYRVF